MGYYFALTVLCVKQLFYFCSVFWEKIISREYIATRIQVIKLSNKETFKKRYFFDNGLLNNFLFDPEIKLLENLVAIELKKRYGNDLFFFNKKMEVDLFIPKERIQLIPIWNMIT